MGFRVVVISKQSKCTYQNDYLVVRGEALTTIHLSEIDTLLIDTTAVSLSAYLLCELMKWKINVIICDEHHNPNGELLPLYANYQSSKRIVSQVNWSPEVKTALWTKIISEKIRNQAIHLKLLNKNSEANLLEKYVMELEFGDLTNREGHAAKVYFNALFGKDFSRRSDNDINAALNYGYALILSSINKEIVSCGYLTQLGICHRNEYNDFNLSCDIMEPFRIAVDKIVMANMPIIFDSEMKIKLINIFNTIVKIDGSEYYFSSAISLYTKNILSCLSEENIEDMEFFEIL